MEKKKISDLDNKFDGKDLSQFTKEEINIIKKQLRKKKIMKSLIDAFILSSIYFVPAIFIIIISIIEGSFYIPFIVFLIGFCLCYFLIFFKVSLRDEKIQEIDLIDKESRMMKNKKDKEEDGVEGILSGKDYDLLDKNQDGRIMVHEFYPFTEDEVLEKILEVDSNFSKTEFKIYVKNIFLIIQEAFSERNISKLRAFEADDLFNQHKLYINGLISNEEIDNRKNINIKGIVLKDFKIDQGKHILTIALTAGMKRTVGNSDFTCDGNIPYILVFARSNNVKTKTNKKLSTTNCCNCGAVIDVDDSGVCNYCGTSLVSGEEDWVLIDIKDIKLVID